MKCWSLEITISLRWGDLLYLVIFNIYLESVAKKVQKYTIDLKVGGKNVVMATYMMI